MTRLPKHVITGALVNVIDRHRDEVEAEAGTAGGQQLSARDCAYRGGPSTPVLARVPVGVDPVLNAGPAVPSARAGSVTEFNNVGCGSRRKAGYET
jgi:hypothetical protein